MTNRQISLLITLLSFLFHSCGFSQQISAESQEAAPQVILLYGTSCAGKSTIATHLQKSLGSSWKILDWDDYANEHGDDRATEILLDDLMQDLLNGYCLIIDTQPCVDISDTLSNYRVISVLIYASLNTLIARDELRQTTLKRSEKRRRYARAYIFETFFQLYGCNSNDDPVDEIYPDDVPTDLWYYPLNEATSDFFQQIAQNNSPVSIYAKVRYDLIINTDQTNIDCAINTIQKVRLK